MGVRFGTYDSRSTWGLDFLGYENESPKAKTNTVNIPLRDGVVDMTQMLSGVVRYENRTITMRFEVRDGRWDWPAKLSAIRSAIHGQRMDVILPDDTSYAWTGRCSVDDFKDNGSTGTLTVSVDAEPFKHKQTYTSMGPYTISGAAQNVDVVVTSDRAYLAFEITGTITMTFDGDTYTFAAGVYADQNIVYTIQSEGQTYVIGTNLYTVPGLFIARGTNRITFNGNGTVKIRVYEGSL